MARKELAAGRMKQIAVIGGAVTIALEIATTKADASSANLQKTYR